MKTFISLLILLFCCVTVFSQIPNNVPFFGIKPASGGAGSSLFVRYLAGQHQSGNAASYTTGAFTPTSNALLYAAIFIANDISVDNVSNSGTTNLTWWQATSRISGAQEQYIYVTQLPAGTSPFSMTVTVTASGSFKQGCNIHVYEVVGANNTTLWGHTAVVQATNIPTAGPGNPMVFRFLQPTVTGNALFLSFGTWGTGDSWPPIESTGWSLGNNPFNGESITWAAYFKTNASAVSLVYFTNTTYQCYAVGMEVK